MIKQEILQFPHGSSAVADAVLRGGIHLRESLVEAVGQEDGVVAEAVGAALLREDDAIHPSFEKVLLAVQKEGDDCFKAGLSVGHAAHFV